MVDVTWHMDAQEERYTRELLAMGRAVADIRDLVRRKRSEKLSDAKISYEELDALLLQFVKARVRDQL